MSTRDAVITFGVAAFLLAVAIVVGYYAVTGRRRRGNYAVLPLRGEEAFIVLTPAGPVYVERVLHDGSGWSYEMLTDFGRRPGDVGEMRRVYWVDLTRQAVMDRCRVLASAHLRGEPQYGAPVRRAGETRRHGA